MTVETTNWKEVSKAKAVSLFNNGQKVYALTSKLNPENMWMKPSLISSEWETSIDGFVNAYRYYNCNKECGMGVKFYIKKGE